VDVQRDPHLIFGGKADTFDVAYAQVRNSAVEFCHPPCLLDLRTSTKRCAKRIREMAEIMVRVLQEGERMRVEQERHTIFAHLSRSSGPLLTLLIFRAVSMAETVAAHCKSLI
jgi:hypothetical protein